MTCDHMLAYFDVKAGICRLCRSERRRGSNTKKARLERVAAAMRAYYLTHGRGCKSTARAIARRQGAA